VTEVPVEVVKIVKEEARSISAASLPAFRTNGRD
jgi:hypothetical protein